MSMLTIAFSPNDFITLSTSFSFNTILYVANPLPYITAGISPSFLNLPDFLLPVSCLKL